MGFQGYRFCLSWWLLLVMLTSLSHGHSSSDEGLVFNSIVDMFESIHKYIQKELSEPRVNSIVGKRIPRSSTTSTSTTISSLNSTSINMEEWLWDIGDISTTTTTTEDPQEGTLFRQLIVFPHRCPEKHQFVAGKCRKRV